MSFATRIKAKVCIATTGFIDTTCPPTSAYTACSHLPTGIVKAISTTTSPAVTPAPPPEPP
jgi:cephalosporin-C deacetylase-like acetyl esterase